MIGKTVRTFLSRKQHRPLVISTVVVLLMGVVGFHFIEGWRWLDAADYSVSTMVTTGNSTVAPRTDAGKYFNIFYMFSSVVLILIFVNTIQQHFRDIWQNKEVQRRRHRKMVEKKISAETTSATDAPKKD